MAKKYLIFIDTNILLDLYRIRNSDITLDYLNAIKKYKDIIITTSQVEMEYKKNRQKLIMDLLKSIKIEVKPSPFPSLIEKTKYAKAIKTRIDYINERVTSLKKDIKNILSAPEKYDKAFKLLRKLFKEQSIYNLNRFHKDRRLIRGLARKRFMLGYPPKKEDDTSIGDSINWEWIIQCAKNSKQHIIIVSRDSDYGCAYEGEHIINDCLLQEFKERVGRKRDIILTNKLSQAFKQVGEIVKKEMEEEEEEVIKQEKATKYEDKVSEIIKVIFSDEAKKGIKPESGTSETPQI